MIPKVPKAFLIITAMKTLQNKPLYTFHPLNAAYDLPGSLVDTKPLVSLFEQFQSFLQSYMRKDWGIDELPTAGVQFYSQPLGNIAGDAHDYAIPIYCCSIAIEHNADLNWKNFPQCASSISTTGNKKYLMKTIQFLSGMHEQSFHVVESTDQISPQGSKNSNSDRTKDEH